MSLSQDNRDYAQRLIRRYEKDAKSWRWWRWLGLAIAVFYMAALIGGDRWVSRKFAAAHQDASLLKPDAPVTAADLDRRLEHHVGLLWFERRHQNTILLNMLVPLFLIAYTISHWNRHKRSALIAALLKEHSGTEQEPDRTK